MDYEKKYKEIVGQIKKAYLYAQTDSTKAVLEEIIPELKESKDERIRKRLIDFFEDWRKNRSHCWGISVTDILAWLEKQGEKKSQRMISAEAKEAMYDKPAWSEEDEEELDIAVTTLKEAGQHSSVIWLKSLKQRIGG